MGFLRRLANGIKAFSREMTKPESFEKGERFERYVRKFVFPMKYYDLVHKTHDFNSNDGDYVESSLKPDFKLRDKKTGREFYVEVKWRKGEYNEENKIQWCNNDQLRRYKQVSKNENKVFVLMGIGSSPTQPKEIVLFPISSCHSTGLPDSFLDRYAFSIKKPVPSTFLWKLR